MSTVTRYAFSLLICLYGVYELVIGQPVPGVIGILLGLFVFWISRRR